MKQDDEEDRNGSQDPDVGTEPPVSGGGTCLVQPRSPRAGRYLGCASGLCEHPHVRAPQTLPRFRSVSGGAGDPAFISSTLSRLLSPGARAGSDPTDHGNWTTGTIASSARVSFMAHRR